MARKVVLSFALGVLAFAQKVGFDSIDPAVLEARLARISADNRTRGEILRQMFTEASCPFDQIGEPKVSASKLPNVIPKLPRESDEAIVVGAHYDKAALGNGAVDNWTGVALLPSLYQSLESVGMTPTKVWATRADKNLLRHERQ